MARFNRATRLRVCGANESFGSRTLAYWVAASRAAMTNLGLRAAFIAEALTWSGTPFAEHGAVKGPNGCVNCGSLLLRCGVNAGIIPDMPMPDIHPKFFVRPQEKLLEFIMRAFPWTVEVPEAMPGDLHLYWFGKAFGHCAIRASETEIVHAYQAAGCVLVSNIDEPLLNFMPIGSQQMPRPVKYLDVLTNLSSRPGADSVDCRSPGLDPGRDPP